MDPEFAKSVNRLYGGKWSIDNGVDMALNDPRLRQIVSVKGRIWNGIFEITQCQGWAIVDGKRELVNVGLRGQFSAKPGMFRRQMVELGKKEGIYMKALGLFEIDPLLDKRG